MAAEGDRLTAMINDVLDLQKIEAGRMEFRHDPVDVVAVVDQACAAVSALFVTSGLELVREVPADGVPSVLGDHHRLIQVVINLLSNAVKFTPAGSVTVAWRPPTRRSSSPSPTPAPAFRPPTMRGCSRCSPRAATR